MEIKVNKNVLISTYADTAYLFTLLNEDNNWFYNYYTQMLCENDGDINFYAKTYDACFLIDYIPFYWREKSVNDNIIKLLISWINKGYCAIIELNQKFVPDRISYGKFDFQHSNMIFGYDTNKQIFNIIGFNQSRLFRDSLVSFDQVIEGFRTIDDYLLPIRFVKQRENMNYQIDWNKIYYDINSYINCGKDDANYGRVLFGLDVIRHLKRKLDDMATGKKPKDARQISVIRDQKIMMLNKIQYFVKSGIDFERNNIVELFEHIKEILVNSVNIYLKFEITNKCNYIEKIKEKIDHVISLEKELYPIVARGIKKHMEKIKWDKPIGFNGEIF